MNDRITIEALGAKVRRLRMERGLSQDRLALESKVDQSGLSKFERLQKPVGDIPLRRIAAVLKLTFDELISDTDYKSAK